MKALSIAATGMDAQQTRVAVISNNLANMNTTAYATRRAEFTDLIYQVNKPSGASAAADGSVVPEGVHLGLGVRTAAVSMDLSQGTLIQTSNDLDLAIEGQGYFELLLPDGRSVYSRAGAFKRTGEGQIVNADGLQLAGNLTIPQNVQTLTINSQGEVVAQFADQPQGQLLGALNLVTFANNKGLEPLGSGLFQESPASGAPNIGQPGLQGFGTLRQGYLEESNVDVVSQIAELIEAQRGYELNSKVMTAADQMLGAATNIR
ncbi:MAG: flagellar basal-body rod protein FlgG [Pseudomonadota bacterium]